MDKVICDYENCNSNKVLNDGYCKNHSKIVFMDNIVKMNKKPCYNHIRGCRSILDLEYTKSRCEECLKKDRENDKIKRQNSQNKIISNNEKVCTTCCKSYPLEQFNGIKNKTKTCLTCREQNKINDANRNKEHRRELARINEAKPKNREIKQKWKENNYDKVVTAWMKYRQKQINTLGVEEYLKKNAEQAKKWRESNPEKVKQNNENKINSLNLNYSIYKRSANDKNLLFELTFDEYMNIVKNNCRYCGFLHERGFNGIDRKSSKIGYTIKNCLSCCKMCNYMKTSVSENNFIKRVEHILTYNNLIQNGKLFLNLFANYTNISFKSYKYRANKKNIEFEINNELFDNIRLNDCYICGKNTNESHKNGIDRLDNSLGYIENNIKSCCGNCNYMKRNYSYDDFINKLKEIFIHLNLKNDEIIDDEIIDDEIIDDEIIDEIIDDEIIDDEIIDDEIIDDEIIDDEIIYDEIIDDEIIDDEELRNIVKQNKKTKEEKKEISRIRIAKKREELKERCNDEEYKKIRSTEIAEYRKNRIITDEKKEELREKEKLRKQKYRESLKV
jgi:hypothetical protein